MKHKRPRLMPKDYPPGHFSAGAIAWLGPRGWTPQGELPRAGNVTRTSQDTPRSAGGWGNGTIVGLSPRSDALLKERGW